MSTNGHEFPRMRDVMSELLMKEEVFKMVGAGFEVRNSLGFGFLEAVYQEAMEIECKARAIPFVAQMPLRIVYKGITLKKSYIADMVCFSAVLLEIKAADNLTSADEAQLLNYMKATGLRVGVLMNFGNKKELEWKRFVL